MNKKLLITLCTTLLIVLVSISCMLFVPSGGDLKFDPDQLPEAQVGVAYDVEIHVSQTRTPVDIFGIADESLPSGLKFEKVEDVENTAKITGVPTQAGTFTFKISARCYGTNVPGQKGEKEYSIVVRK